MEVLFHFIFQLFKIAVLAFVYSFFLSKVSTLLNKYRKTLKVISIARAYFPAYLVLLFFSFSYYGNHGLGDGPKIPIGNWKTIENTNWEDYGYLNINNSNNRPIQLKRFLVQKNKLCGEYGGFFYSYNNQYLVYDLSADKIKEFGSKETYNAYATKHKLPQAHELLSFSQNYSNYWGGIRFLLLP